MTARLRSRYEGNRYVERMTYPLKSSVKNAAERELLESPLVFETRDPHARSGRSLKKKNQIEEVKSRDLRVAAFSFYAGSSRKRLFRFFLEGFRADAPSLRGRAYHHPVGYGWLCSGPHDQRSPIWGLPRRNHSRSARPSPRNQSECLARRSVTRCAMLFAFSASTPASADR